MIKIGIIGFGYWGPNYRRILEKSKKAKLTAVADLNTQVLKEFKNTKIQTFSNYKDLLKTDVDAVIIVTPTSTHYQIVKNSIRAKKHVLCEKPLSTKTNECKHLAEMSKKNKVILATGYTFIYNSAFQALKKLIDSQDLGKIYYLIFQRMNLGPIRADVNAMWDLAPHDVSMLYYLIRKPPKEVYSTGGHYLNGKNEDVVFTNLKFSNGITAYIASSWLAPVKIRDVVIVGSKKMAVFDDVLLKKKIAVFDKGVKLPPRGASYADFSKAGLKTGSLLYPKYKNTEPLANQLNHFLNCIDKNMLPETDGEFSTGVTSILEAAQKSLLVSKAVRI